MFDLSQPFLNLVGCSEEVLKGFEANCIDSIVTDPPSGYNMMMASKQGHPDRYLGFDNPLGHLRYNFKTQNSFSKRLRPLFFNSISPVFNESYRVLKPGGYIIAWGFVRTLCI